jgi:glycine/serine hydroxymethyltransferase
MNVMFAGVRSVNKAGEKVMYDLENKINQAVFPGLQGGPHNNAIAGIATALQQAMTSEFHEYQKQVWSFFYLSQIFYLPSQLEVFLC